MARYPCRCPCNYPCKCAISYYLEKRGIKKEYNSKGAYDFDSWKHYLTSQIRSRYETLHKDLLYTDEQQNFEDALLVFEKVNKIFMEIDE